MGKVRSQLRHVGYWPDSLASANPPPELTPAARRLAASAIEELNRIGVVVTLDKARRAFPQRQDSAARGKARDRASRRPDRNISGRASDAGVGPMNGAESLFAPLPGSLPSGEATGEARTWTPPQGRADIAPSRYERIERDGYMAIDAHWVVPALQRSAPIEGRVLEPAAGPFSDDSSPTPKRASSQRRDALWANPQRQALTQEDDANDDPIPPAR
jgi:hypothetical protein